LHDNTYYVGLCTTELAFQKELKRLAVPRNEWPSFISTKQAHATCHFFEKDDGKKIALVCIGSMSGRTGIEIAGLLIHEAVHIWQAHHEDIGEHRPSHEFEAYAIQRIAMNLMDAFEQTLKGTT